MSLEDDIQKTNEALAVRQAFLEMDGIFDSLDIFSHLKAKGMSENIPVDNISDLLERFLEKGEIEVVEKGTPTKYRKTIETR